MRLETTRCRLLVDSGQVIDQKDQILMDLAFCDGMQIIQHQNSLFFEMQ